MATTGFLSDPRFLDHDTGPGHPERPDRLRAVLERLETGGIAGELDHRAPRLATREELERVHPAQHVDRVETTSGRGPTHLDGDTTVSPGSWDAARLAAGGLIDATERVLDGTWDNAFCTVRPPGHHAEKDRSMGFCLFNNVAVAAESLRRRGIERVAIVDWDVHHGNGTQHVFEDRADVFYASLHQWPLYPGTGAARERGRGDGEGATLNRPMPAGSRDADWVRALEESVLPELEAFAPEFVLLSAGFDAHVRDPLAGCEVTEDGYRAMTRGLLELADRCAQGRLVSVLEGGYDLEGLALSVEAHLEELRAHGGTK